MLVASEQKPRDQRRGRRGAVSALMAIVALGCLYVAAPRLAGIEQTWHRIRDGSPAWLSLALLFEAVSFLGYVWLLRRVATRDNRALPWAEAWRVTLAGVAATRIVTVAGAGGIAITVAALRRAGFTTREAAERQAVHLVALYACFFGAMVAVGAVLAVSGRRGSRHVVR